MNENNRLGVPGDRVLANKTLYADALAVSKQGKGVRFKVSEARGFDAIRCGVQRLARFDGYRARFQRTGAGYAVLWIDLMPSGQRGSGDRV